MLAAPGAGLALGLLLGINLFNYIDRQVLAAILDDVEGHFLPQNGNWNRFLMGAAEHGLHGFLHDLRARIWLVGRSSAALVAGRPRRGHLEPGQRSFRSFQCAGGLGGFWLFFMTRCFVGIGEAAYGPVAPAVISDLYPERIRGQVLSWFHAAIPVGSALGYTLGG